MKKPMPPSLARQLTERFNEIEMPEELGRLPGEQLDSFFFERGWLIFVKMKNAHYLCVKPEKKKP